MKKQYLKILLMFITFSRCDSRLEHEVSLAEAISYTKSRADDDLNKIISNFKNESEGVKEVFLKNKILENLGYETDSLYLIRQFSKDGIDMFNKFEGEKIFKEYGINWFYLLSKIYTKFCLITRIIYEANEIYKKNTSDENIKKTLEPFKILNNFINDANEERFPELNTLIELLVLGLKNIKSKKNGELVTQVSPTLLESCPKIIKKNNIEKLNLEKERDNKKNIYELAMFSKREILDMSGYQKGLIKDEIEISDIKKYLMINLNTESFLTEDLDKMKKIELHYNDGGEEVIKKNNFYKFSSFVRGFILQKLHEKLNYETSSDDMKIILDYIKEDCCADKTSNAVIINKNQTSEVMTIINSILSSFQI